jgi:hypothetical protein
VAGFGSALTARHAWADEIVDNAFSRSAEILLPIVSTIVRSTCSHPQLRRQRDDLAPARVAAVSVCRTPRRSLSARRG